MKVKINRARATQILEEEVELAKALEAPTPWALKTRAIFEACHDKGHPENLTIVAMLGTGLLAKAADLRADPMAVKSRGTKPGAHSARSLVQHVLAAHAPRLGIDLGVSGREPLNNQPFFRLVYVDDSPPPVVRRPEAFQLLIEALQAARAFTSTAEARAALRGFLFDRLKEIHTVTFQGNAKIQDVSSLITLIKAFVEDKAEYGKRAQAVVAGLMDTLVCQGEDANPTLRVDVGRIHDPDRHFAGDVGLRHLAEDSSWDRAFEVRAKPVSEPDLYHLVQKAIDNNISKFGVLAASPKQKDIDTTAVCAWAMERGVMLVLYVGWDRMIEDCIFWSSLSPSEAIAFATEAIFKRATELEVSGAGLELWIGKTTA